MGFKSDVDVAPPDGGDGVSLAEVEGTAFGTPAPLSGVGGGDGGTGVLRRAWFGWEPGRFPPFERVFTDNVWIRRPVWAAIIGLTRVTVPAQYESVPFH